MIKRGSRMFCSLNYLEYKEFKLHYDDINAGTHILIYRCEYVYIHRLKILPLSDSPDKESWNNNPKH